MFGCKEGIVYLCNQNNLYMTFLEVLMMIAVLYAAYSLYQEWNREGNDAEREMDEIMSRPNMTQQGGQEGSSHLTFATKELVLQTLMSMGCEYKEENYTTIQVRFQGRTFIVDANNGNAFIRVIFPWWYEFPMEDVEEFARVQRAINEVKTISGLCAYPLYTVNKENSLVGIHSKCAVIFVEQIPEIAQYLTHIFEDHFTLQRELMTEIEKYKKLEGVI